MYDDEATKVALGLIEAFDAHHGEVMAPALAHMGADELRLIVLKLAALTALRTKVGAEIEDTGQWVRWLRVTLPDLVL